MRVRDLRPTAEDAAARYLIGEDANTGDRVVVVVARPVADLPQARAEAHADARLRQAAASGRLDSARIAPVRAVGRTASGHPFAVSSLDGAALLSETIAEYGAVGPAWSIAVMSEAAAILAEVHAAGLVHGNVGVHTIVTGGRHASVMLHSLGIAAPWSAAAARRNHPEPDDGGASTLKRGDAVPDGSPLAQAQRADVRSLAGTLRYLLAGPGGTGRALTPAAAALLERAEGADGTVTAQDLSTRLAGLAREVRERVPVADDAPPAPAVQPHAMWGGDSQGRRFMLVAIVLAASFVLLLLLRLW